MVFDKTLVKEGRPLGFSTFKASIQPNGFFYQCWSNSPYGRPYIYSESVNKYWQLTSEDVEVSSKSPINGGSDTNRLQIICADMRQHVVDVLNLGIEGLDNKNIKWVSRDEFTSPLMDWVGKPTSGKLDVKILSFYRNLLPSTLQCISTTEDGEKQQYSIFLQYDLPLLPPREIVVKKSKKDGSIYYRTNIINNIVFGLREDAMEGFMPSNFFATNVSSTRLFVESNGLVYNVYTDGAWQLIDQSGIGVTAPHQQSRTRTNFIRLVFCILLLLPVAVILYKAVSGKERNK